MSNNTHDNIPDSEINKRKPRPMCDWDQLEQERENNASKRNNSKYSS